MSMLDTLDPTKMNLDELLDEFIEIQGRIIRLEELKAPSTLIEYEQQKFNSISVEISKYVSMKNLTPLLEKRKLERKKEHDAWRKEYLEEIKSSTK